MKHLSVASGLVVLIVFVVTFVAATVDAIHTDYSVFIALLTSGVASLVALVVVIFWAIPVHLILNRINKSGLVWYILAALIPSFAFIYALKPFGQDTNFDLLIQALFCSFAGTLGAIVFWYIAVYKKRITSGS